MKPRYKAILIDDEEENRLTPITDRFRKNLSFEIDIVQPKIWDSKFIKYITDISNKCDCIILDWRLDQHVIKEGYTVAYKGAELCQLIRRKTAEKKVRSLPIFLWSTDQNLGHSYTDDFTSHDLFDRIYKKDKDLKGSELLQSGKEMMFFIEFYRILRSLKRAYNLNDFLSILGLTQATAHWLDERAKEYLIGLIGSGASRIPLFSRFIYKDVVKTSGILISEDLLAARLGVDKEKSSNWKNLLSHKAIKSLEYNGFFKDDKDPKFWMQGLYELWTRVAPNENSLFLTSAEKRVSLISAFLKIGSLVPLKKNGKFFWYLDSRTQIPVDPENGQQSMHNVKFSWQDPLFVVRTKKNKTS